VQLTVEIVWSDIGSAAGDVIAVGHYQDVYPTASEAALDAAVSGAVARDQRLLYGATARGVLRGELGEINVFPWHHGDTTKHVAVVGLGRPGTFGPAQQAIAFRNLLWTAERLVRGEALAMVLMGAGAGNLTLQASIRSLVEALDSNAREGAIGGSTKTVRIVEFELGRARRIHRLLDEMIRARRGLLAPVELQLAELQEVNGVVSAETAFERLIAANLHAESGIDGLIAEVESTDCVRDAIRKRLKMPSLVSLSAQGDLRLRFDRGPETSEVPTRLTILVRDGELMVAAISDSATVAERQTGLDVELFLQLIEQANAEADGDVERAGRLLLDFAVPVDFRALLSRGTNVVVEVDPITAALQWEILPGEAPTVGLSTALGLRSALARQLRTTRSRPPTASLRTPIERVLVIGDPGGARDAIDLPGARQEAMAIAALLSDPRLGIEVDLLVGTDGLEDGTPPATLRNVLHHLLHFPYDVVHYAGHGTFTSDDPSRGSGWSLGDRLLRGKHLTMAERMPALVVANACHSSRISTGLPGLADEFLGRGVRNLVGTSRTVDDSSARRFSETLYKRLLGIGPNTITERQPLGDAVLAARKDLATNKRADWDAYQLYGDPEFRFADPTEESDDA
jgi:hypothetical protein